MSSGPSSPSGRRRARRRTRGRARGRRHRRLPGCGRSRRSSRRRRGARPRACSRRPDPVAGVGVGGRRCVRFGVRLGVHRLGHHGCLDDAQLDRADGARSLSGVGGWNRGRRSLGDHRGRIRLVAGRVRGGSVDLGLDRRGWSGGGAGAPRTRAGSSAGAGGGSVSGSVLGAVLGAVLSAAAAPGATSTGVPVLRAVSGVTAARTGPGSGASAPVSPAGAVPGVTVPVPVPVVRCRVVSVVVPVPVPVSGSVAACPCRCWSRCSRRAGAVPVSVSVAVCAASVLVSAPCLGAGGLGAGLSPVVRCRCRCPVSRVRLSAPVAGSVAAESPAAPSVVVMSAGAAASAWPAGPVTTGGGALLRVGLLCSGGGRGPWARIDVSGSAGRVGVVVVVRFGSVGSCGVSSTTAWSICCWCDEPGVALRPRPRSAATR